MILREDSWKGLQGKVTLRKSVYCVISVLKPCSRLCEGLVV